MAGEDIAMSSGEGSAAKAQLHKASPPIMTLSTGNNRLRFCETIKEQDTNKDEYAILTNTQGPSANTHLTKAVASQNQFRQE